MYRPDYQNKSNTLLVQYAIRFEEKRQTLVNIRKHLRIPQTEISRLSGLTLRTIQNWEAGRSMDYYLIFCYQQIITGHQQTTPMPPL